MSHRFSNFADAYAYLNTRWSVARGFQNDAYDKASEAISYANAGDWKNGIKQLAYGLMDTLSAFDNLFENLNHDIDYSVHGECLYWASQEGGNGVIDMTAILNALWDAKPHQCLLFVPMIDAMRGSIMEKTVTLDYMARALRHFKE